MKIKTPKKAQTPYKLGLDIGIASVGWALLAEDHIINLGVRAFDKAETDKEGDPLNLNRRIARLTRRRIRRRAARLKQLAKLLAEHGVIAEKNVLADDTQHPTRAGTFISTWQLRAIALDELLSADEWARVIYHMCKHRGFYWVSRAEQKEFAGLPEDGDDKQSGTDEKDEEAKKEQKKIKANLKQNRLLMQEKGYRSVAEMMLAEYSDAQRNKHNEYTKALPRELIGEELALLFEKQRALGSKHASTVLETQILGDGDKKTGLFWHQQPALSGKALLKMLGKCSFEKEEYRAPKESYSAERQVWLTRLNNLRIIQNGSQRSLSKQEHESVINAPYMQKSDYSYKQLRNALAKAGSDLEGASFIGLHYGLGDNKKDPEKEKLVILKGWQKLDKAMTQAGLGHAWQEISGKAIAGQPRLLDNIAWVLAVYKEDDEISRELGKLDLDQRMIDCLLEIRFDQFHKLSLKALQRIVPQMEQGDRYDQAYKKAGYHHSFFEHTDKGRYLPSLYQVIDKKLVLNPGFDLPRNPVVLRSLNQARKVVNAIIKYYGSPENIHVEMARDIAKPSDERRRIEKEQTQNRNKKQQMKDEFAGCFGRPPDKGEFRNYRLYREQDGFCAYSLKPIDTDRLLEAGYVEIDHILPWSRSYDDMLNNKVLVLTAENRNKGNKTPYEYFGDDPQRWNSFVAKVQGNPKLSKAKLNRLLNKDFKSDDFRKRNLNDTRYACRFFKNFIENYLLLSEASEHKRCVVVSGQMTDLLRVRWGLHKNRAESDRHHALDAAVVAAASHAMVKKASDFARYRETRYSNAEYVDPETGEIFIVTEPQSAHFPQPWEGFRDELRLRVFEDDKEQLQQKLKQLPAYSSEALEDVKPLFVSRAPKRRRRGSAHKETINAKPKDIDIGKQVIKRVKLLDLKPAQLDALVDPHCNKKLYAAIRQRLEQFGGNAKKAFAEPLYKPDKQGMPTGPIVRSIRIFHKQSGIPVRGGIAANGSMIRVDVFKKEGKYHLIPIYVHQIGKPLPNRAVIQDKNEEDWMTIDESFDWCFSLYANDYIKLSTKKGVTQGYFAGMNRANGNIDIWLHDRNTALEKNGKVGSLGVKTALDLAKYHVDVLGNTYPAKEEPRGELA